MLLSLGQAELRSIQEEIGFAEVTCHFCNTVITINDAELQTLLESPKQE